MNNIASFGHKFFLFGGAILIAIAALQILTRPRAKAEAGGRKRPFDVTTVRSVLFVTVGVLAILVGAGVIPLGPGR
jgi:hypothetical protein